MTSQEISEEQLRSIFWQNRLRVKKNPMQFLRPTQGSTASSVCTQIGKSKRQNLLSYTKKVLAAVYRAQKVFKSDTKTKLN